MNSEVTISSAETDEYGKLITRAREYEKERTDTCLSTSTPVPKKASKGQPPRSKFLICQEHSNSESSLQQSEISHCSSCIKFKTAETLPNGVLPTCKEVLEYVLTNKRICGQSGQKKNVVRECAVNLALHWIYCNVYTVSVSQIQREIETFFKTYDTIFKYANSRKNEAFWNTKYSPFLSKMGQVFNIIGEQFT